ncbi:MAG: proteasome ATPase [Acidimicrobiales bacterium]
MDETTDDDGGISNIRAQAAELQDEIGVLHDRLADAPKRVRTLEDRLTTQKAQLAKAVSQNERLVLALQEARQHIAQLRDEVDKLTKPPSGYGTMLGENTDGSVDVYSSGRKLRVEVHPDLAKTIRRGQEVVLNEAMNVILARGGTTTGEVAVLREVMADGRRATISTRGDETKVCTLAEHLVGANLRGGETVLIEPRANVVLERVPKPEAEQLVLEEVPDVSYADVGGLEVQIEAITDAVELPFLHSELFAEYDLPAPKGILLYGPPGCGKTLIAKAVANSLATKVAAASGGGPTKSYFFNIKGPELLNKYVGETERQIRAVFERAREKAAEGWPVIVFFDEMESLFRTRGTGISSDMESTIVPQLLAEIDGVEALNNVIVIGASNREDLIDPAILRPGRLDVKIKIERPNTEAATAIFGRYLTTLTPIGPTGVENVGGGGIDKAIQGMIEQTVADMYAAEEQNQFLEVTYQNGDKEIIYYRDFSSGAMIENIVRRAKKLAIKRELAGGNRGVVLEDLIASVHQEFKEHEDLPNTTNPDDWARISGKKGERIVFVRTLMTQDADPHGGKAIEGVGTGQYL